MPDFSCLTTSLLDYELGSNDSTQLFTTSRRQASVKQGEAEFADLTECCLRESTLTLTGGTQEYDLNSTTRIAGGDLSRIAAQGLTYRYTDASSNISYVEGDQFPRRDIPWLNQYVPGWRSSTGSQLPESWYLRGDQGRLFLGFYPMPSTGSSAVAECVVPYVAQPSTASASTNSTYMVWTIGTIVRQDLVPYHQACVHYAAHQLEKLRKDQAASDRQLQKFLGYVARYLQARREKDGGTLRFGRTYLRARGVGPSLGYGPGGVPDPYRWP